MSFVIGLFSVGGSTRVSANEQLGASTWKPSRQLPAWPSSEAEEL